MILSVSLSRRQLFAIIAAGVLPGCQWHGRNQRGTNVGSSIPAPIPPGALTLRIVGICAPPRQMEHLQFLILAIRDRLVELGGLRLADVVSEICEPDCRTEVEKRTAETADAHRSGFQMNEALPEVPDSHSMATAAVDTRTDLLELHVRIDEFQTYRPMRVNAAFSVHETLRGDEISAIQKTWYAPEAGETDNCPPWSLKAYFNRTPTWGGVEAASLASLSPRAFLNSVAGEVAPAIHLACLTHWGTIIGSDLSIPQGSVMSR